MRIKLLILGIVVALVATLVVPLAVSASPPGITITGSLTATTPPSYTTPLYVGDTSMGGTATPGANITVTVNGTPYYAIANAITGNWTVSIPALTSGATVSVTAQASHDVNSTPVTTAVAVDFASLTVPSGFVWTSNGGAFEVGTNTGSAATAGTVTSGNDSWTLSVADNNTSVPVTEGYMTSGGGYTVPLGSPIQVGMTAGTVGTISNYQGEIQNNPVGSNPNYGLYQGQGTVTDSIPLCASQVASANDAAGSYSITLNYTLSPGD